MGNSILYSGWREQYDRAKRWHGRIQDHNVDSHTYVDYLWAYFQNCWALKDWLKNDPGVAQTVRAQIETSVNNCRSLRIVADLANRSKHLTLVHTPREDARVSSLGVQLTLLAPVGADETPESKPLVISRHFVYVDGTAGPLGKALKIAEDALGEWEQLLRAWNLI